MAFINLWRDSTQLTILSWLIKAVSLEERATAPFITNSDSKCKAETNNLQGSLFFPSSPTQATVVTPASALRGQHPWAPARTRFHYGDG